MMELCHIAMVNWHLFDVEDIEVTGHAGVFGENRSGKSTILDMAQVVLTGGNRNLQRLNAVAGDKGRSRSASKRSVVDYCLGTLGEDQRKREQARTYICLGFRDKQGKRPSVSIGMAIEARRSESNETVLARFVVTGKILTTADFIEVRDGKRFSAEWDGARNRIVASVGQEHFVNHRDKAIDYVREYMRRLVPHASVVGEQNANSLQKAVVNAMTLDHDQTATEFVRNYILEKNNMRVGELRESIRTYRNINDTIRTMREKLEALVALRSVLDDLAAAHERRACEQWIAKRANWLTARAAYDAFAKKHIEETAKRGAAKAELDFLDEEWRHKPVGFVGYGGVAAGARAIQALIPVVVALGMAPAPRAVHIPLINRAVTADGSFASDDRLDRTAMTLLDNLFDDTVERLATNRAAAV